MERTGEGTYERALPRRFLRAGRGQGAQTPPPRPAPPPPLSSSATKSLTDADHFGMIRKAQRRFAPPVIGITRNSDRHQIGMSDRHRRNTHQWATFPDFQAPKPPSTVSRFPFRRGVPINRPIPTPVRPPTGAPLGKVLARLPASARINPRGRPHYTWKKAAFQTRDWLGRYPALLARRLVRGFGSSSTGWRPWVPA